MNSKADSATAGPLAGGFAGRALVSIIIPMRNEEHFVGRCLDSILSQVEGRDDIEILCVDGASTDRMLRFANSGQKAVVEELNWEKEAELLVRFYQRLFDERILPDQCCPHRKRGAGSVTARPPGE